MCQPVPLSRVPRPAIRRHAAALLAAAVLLAGPVAPPARAARPVASASDDAPLFSSGAWLGACDNARACSVFGFADDDAAVLVLRLPSGRDGVGSLILHPEHLLPHGQPVHLQVGRRGAALFLRIDRSTANRADAVLDQAQVTQLLVLLRQNGRLVLSTSPSRPQGRPVPLGSLRLAGAATVLDWVSRAQRRPAANVAPVREPPAFDPSILPSPGAPPSTVAALPAVRACGREDSALPGQNAIGSILSPRVVLWRIPCGSDNVSANTLFVLADDGHASPAIFKTPSQFPSRPAGVLADAAIEAGGRILVATEPARGLNDCGDVRRYRWDGQRYRLFRAQLMPACHGLAPDDWPVVFRAGPETAGW